MLSRLPSTGKNKSIVLYNKCLIGCCSRTTTNLDSMVRSWWERVSPTARVDPDQKAITYVQDK